MNRLSAGLLATVFGAFAGALGFVTGEYALGALSRCDVTRSLCEGPALIGLLGGLVAAIGFALITVVAVYRKLRHSGSRTPAA